MSFAPSRLQDPRLPPRIMPLPFYQRFCLETRPHLIARGVINDHSSPLVQRLSMMRAPSPHFIHHLVRDVTLGSRRQFIHLEGKGTVDPVAPNSIGDQLSKSGNAELLDQSAHAVTVFGRRGTEIDGLGACNCFTLRRSRISPISDCFDALVREALFERASRYESLSITFLPSGHLFNEMAILLGFLRRLGKDSQGHLSIQIIDHINGDWIDGTNRTTISKSVADFWHMMVHAAGENVTLELNVFSSLDDYVASSRFGEGCDALVGVDLSNAWNSFYHTASLILKPTGFAAALVKVGTNDQNGRPEFRLFNSGQWKYLSPIHVGNRRVALLE